MKRPWGCREQGVLQEPQEGRPEAGEVDLAASGRRPMFNFIPRAVGSHPRVLNWGRDTHRRVLKVAVARDELQEVEGESGKPPKAERLC